MWPCSVKLRILPVLAGANYRGFGGNVSSDSWIKKDKNGLFTCRFSCPGIGRLWTWQPTIVRPTLGGCAVQGFLACLPFLGGRNIPWNVYEVTCEGCASYAKCLRYVCSNT